MLVRNFLKSMHNMYFHNILCIFHLLFEDSSHACYFTLILATEALQHTSMNSWSLIQESWIIALLID